MNKICFVEMPFAKKFDSVWKAIIKPFIESIGDKCIRVDDIFTTGSILADIFNSIQRADYIIAELTDPNPNVYYELGYSHALNKEVILITQNISSLPFDLRHQRVITYTDTAAGAIELKEKLKNFIDNF